MSVHAGCPIILARTADMFMMCSADFRYHPACTYMYAYIVPFGQGEVKVVLVGRSVGIWYKSDVLVVP